MPSAPNAPLALHLLLAAIAAGAIGLPIALASLVPPAAQIAAQRIPDARVVPAAEMPPVEPVKLVDLTPEDARAYNASIPFTKDRVPAAGPFHITGSTADQERAIACLGAAEIYEAGDDADGEKAVAQVVLNRARHPAFPHSVCAVVFEGASRSTGCQFTFTCDGALKRWRPSAAAWTRARKIAVDALNGNVDEAVGYATHYHTDWVVPYWSASLDKIARVGSHLFFRWSGWWGTPAAFNRRIEASEPVIVQLASLSAAHTTSTEIDDVALPLDAAAIANGGLPAPAAGVPDTFLVTLQTSWSADSLPALAKASCGARAYCKFMAWPVGIQAPTSAILTPGALETMAFSYLRDTAGGYDKALWNCAVFKRDDEQQCMKRRPRAKTRANIVVPFPIATASAPDGLPGVRRKNEALARAAVPGR